MEGDIVECRKEEDFRYSHTVAGVKVKVARVYQGIVRVGPIYFFSFSLTKYLNYRDVKDQTWLIHPEHFDLIKRT